VTLQTDWSRSPIGIAGAGRVGQVLARMLRESRQPLACIASRTRERAREAAAGAGIEAASYAELPRRVSRILICVPDSALETVAGQVRPVAGLVLHTCGTRGPEALEAIRNPRVACGTLHPLQTIADAAAGADVLRGVAFAVAGDEPAVAWAEQIACLAGGRVLRIAAEARPLYHAAAVMGSNYVVALVAAARALMVAAGVEAVEALGALAPLARTSLENALRDPVAALTGPIERGDLETIEAHLRALRAAPEPIDQLYRAAGLEALAVARQRGLDAGCAGQVEASLRARLSGT